MFFIFINLLLGVAYTALNWKEPVKVKGVKLLILFVVLFFIKGHIFLNLGLTFILIVLISLRFATRILKSIFGI